MKYVYMTQESKLHDFLRELEEALLQPEVRQSPEAVSRLLADDFREFGSSGNTLNKRQIIEALEQESGDKVIALSSFETMMLAPDVVLVTYQTSRSNVTDEETVHALRSSIWKRQDGNWQMVFHQGTPASDAYDVPVKSIPGFQATSHR